MALHSRLVLPDAALRPHCRLLLDAVVEASAQRQLLPDAAVRLHCQQPLPDAALRLPCQQQLPDGTQPWCPDQQHLSCHGAPCQQQHPDGTQPRCPGWPASSSASAPPASNISADTAPLPATASRWHSATASRLAGQQLCLGSPASNSFPMALSPGAPASNISADTAPPASNKPHSAERSTPVWLAIWRTWAG